jgi:hypothetical protein
VAPIPIWCREVTRSAYTSLSQCHKCVCAAGKPGDAGANPHRLQLCCWRHKRGRTRPTVHHPGVHPPDRPANRRPERAFAMGPIISSGMATGLLSRVIADGRLPIGSELYHASRLHPERAVTGRVVSGGIEVNGQVYPSPSTAARAVTHSAAENGWAWWRVRDTGRPLAELRDQR